MCDKAVNDSPVTFKLIPDWFVISKMIKNFFTALYANENIFYFNEDFDNVVFFCNKMCVLDVDPKKLTLITIFKRMILILLFLSDFWFGILNLKNVKHFIEYK